MNIKDIVKNNVVRFWYYRQQNFYYTIEVWLDDELRTADFYFPVPLEEVGDASLNSQDKAIYFMRWIRKAMDAGEFLRWDS